MIHRRRALLLFRIITSLSFTICCGPSPSTLLAAANPVTPQAPAGSDRLSVAKKLSQEGHWQQILELAPASPDDSAELDYYRGIALAHLLRWREAETSFRTGQSKQPLDKRFPLELAGVAFKQKKYSEARRHLRRALRLDPHDAYGTEFLATVELLDQNLEAALELWNRLQKPRVRELKADPQPRLDPVLLDHAFAFSPAGLLKLEDYQTTSARLDMLGVFPRYQFELVPRARGDAPETNPGDRSASQGEDFDLVFRAQERNGWGDSRLEGVLSLLRGAPYETLYPEYFNWRRSATNFTSLVRWDDNKRRLYASLSAPLRRDPKWRYQLYADARDENWDLTQTFHLAGLSLSNLNLQKVEIGAEVRSAVSGRWGWSTGLEFSDRWFRNAQGRAAFFFNNGFSMKYRAGLDYRLLDRPQDRFTVDSSVSEQLGRFFSSPSSFFSKTQGSLLLRWFPQPRGDDYETSAELRGGNTQGRIPFDELFILGLERDNDLRLRAHIGTRKGKKGSAPLGPDFVLSNWEINKNLYRGALFDVRIAPFVDSGQAYDSSGSFGSEKWLWDMGGQVKVRVLGGVTVIFTYGKDLRSGKDAYYATVEH